MRSSSTTPTSTSFMHLVAFLLCALSLATIAHGYLEFQSLPARHADSHFRSTCHQIATAVSHASEVYFPRDQATPEYLSDISHTYVSSSEGSACSVEPGSVEDVSKILCILGSTRTPFAVKGGGHASNPGFSSTKGVQLSMTRFKDINVDAGAAMVEVGAGLTWDQVYAVLEQYGVNVVGGRVPRVGVAGLTLGGGYSWISKQYGLTVDNVAGYELVLPNGTITAVTSDDADLWFALRGGFNNFGIVTKFIFKSYPQSGVWGGFLVYSQTQLDLVKDAVVKFQEKNDSKAAAVFALSYSSGTPEIATTAVLFYDAPTLPQGIFDDFLAIPTVQNNVSSRSFSDLVLSLNIFNPPSNVPTRSYYIANSFTGFSPGVFDAFVNQVNLWGGRLGHLDEALALTAVFEPFDSRIFSHGSDSAYPPDRSLALFPSVLQYSWSNASLDYTFVDAMRQQSDALYHAALADGQNVSHGAVYTNYALFDTPLEDMYGANVPRLHKIRAEIDPEDVMGLAGGFKF